MSTGAAHPSSTNPSVLQHPIENADQNWEYCIIISGDCLGIMSKAVDAAEADNQLVVWNWKTGKVMMVRSPSSSLFKYNRVESFSTFIVAEWIRSQIICVPRPTFRLGRPL